MYIVAWYGQAVPSELRPITDLTALHRPAQLSASPRSHAHLLLLLLLLLQITLFL